MSPYNSFEGRFKNREFKPSSPDVFSRQIIVNGGNFPTLARVYVKPATPEFPNPKMFLSLRNANSNTFAPLTSEEARLFTVALASTFESAAAILEKQSGVVQEATTALAELLKSSPEAAKALQLLQALNGIQHSVNPLNGVFEE